MAVIPDRPKDLVEEMIPNLDDVEEEESETTADPHVTPEFNQLDVGADEFDKTVYDPFIVDNKQPGMHYRLVNKNARNMAQKKREGYEVVDGDSPETLSGVTDATPMKAGEDVDSTRSVSDVVLMKVPEVVAEKKRAHNRRMIKRREAAVGAEVKKMAGGNAFSGAGGGGWSGSMSESQFGDATSGKDK